MSGARNTGQPYSSQYSTSSSKQTPYSIASSSPIFFEGAGIHPTTPAQAIAPTATDLGSSRKRKRSLRKPEETPNKAQKVDQTSTSAASNTASATASTTAAAAAASTAATASAPVAMGNPMTIDDKKRNKLGYHRTSVACGHCRRRKIRCLIPEDEVPGRCTNCIRLKKDCHFFPVDQSIPPSERRGDKRSTTFLPPNKSSIQQLHGASSDAFQFAAPHHVTSRSSFSLPPEATANIGGVFASPEDIAKRAAYVQNFEAASDFGHNFSSVQNSPEFGTSPHATFGQPTAYSHSHWIPQSYNINRANSDFHPPQQHGNDFNYGIHRGSFQSNPEIGWGSRHGSYGGHDVHATGSSTDDVLPLQKRAATLPTSYQTFADSSVDEPLSPTSKPAYSVSGGLGITAGNDPTLISMSNVSGQMGWDMSGSASQPRGYTSMSSAPSTRLIEQVPLPPSAASIPTTSAEFGLGNTSLQPDYTFTSADSESGPAPNYGGAWSGGY